MEQLALPAMSGEQLAEVRDQLPLSGSGKLITTVEPKFIPREAVPVTLGEDQKVRIRLIDCVGYLVKDASGHVEEGRERMVKTPWSSRAIPFHEAAEVGTGRVIREHSTIGLLITGDGSFGEIPGENFREAEEKTVQELKKQGKTIILILHDLSQAVRISDTLVVMNRAGSRSLDKAAHAGTDSDVKATDFPGSIAMVGTPQECLQSHVIEDVFQTSWKRFTDEDGEYYFFE